jgi:RNase adapter protein RapZ
MSVQLDHLVIITGLSGAGKSYVQSTLEDLGFYCTDNLPTALIEPFLEEVTSEGHRKIGIVIDVRTANFADEFPTFYRERLKSVYPNATLIFLEARDEVLARRFSETRRPHPYGVDVPINEAIEKEREALLEAKSISDLVLDTSQFSVHELKAQIIKMFRLPGYESPMLVTIISFGFKYSIPYNIDLLFDVRFLPNPHFVAELRPKTGMDEEVVNYLKQQPEYEEFATRLIDFVTYLVPQYQKEMKSYLTIGIGCTGGKHRSVALTQRLAGQLTADGYNVDVVHRDCGR